jgi:PHP family Zn ribbon phosphoesterase
MRTTKRKRAFKKRGKVVKTKSNGVKPKINVLNYVSCLRCQKRFPSRDRRLNRICPRCAEINETVDISKIELSTVRIPKTPLTHDE